MTRTGSLTIVGTGIQLAGQITMEALGLIKRADRVFYLAGDVATARWMHQLNAASQGLADCYAEGRPRVDTYREMTDRMLQPLHEGQRVVAAFYGHPGVGVDAAHAALRAAAALGFEARMLPGVSAEACLIADLAVDPVQSGWQSYEAWAFLHRRPRYDSRTPLILWQLGLVYQTSIDFSGRSNEAGVRDVTRLLQESYPDSHAAILYEASPFPVCKARIDHVAISQLPQAGINVMTTLFVPALAEAAMPT